MVHHTRHGEWLLTSESIGQILGEDKWYSLFEINVKPLCWCNAQRLIDLVLAGAEWSTCLVYLDDIAIVRKTFHQHLVNVRGVLGKLRQAGLHLKPDKCAFFQANVREIGHLLQLWDQPIVREWVLYNLQLVVLR